MIAIFDPDTAYDMFMDTMPDDLDDLDIDTCPDCAGTDVEGQTFSGDAWGFQSYGGVDITTYRCTSCGANWES